MDMTGWFPIDTAPTDGSEVEVYVDDIMGEGLPPFITRLGYHPDAGWCADELRVATHWRPIPAESCLLRKALGGMKL